MTTVSDTALLPDMNDFKVPVKNMEIKCEHCGRVITNEDVVSGKAFQNLDNTTESIWYCADCAPLIDNPVLQDSGAREQYTDDSAIREPETGKGRYDLISPIALHRLAQHYENGAKKYKDRNWEKGIPLSRLLSSASRHLNKLIAGMDDEDHAAAVVWNIFAFMHIKELINRDKLSEIYNDLPEGMDKI